MPARSGPSDLTVLVVAGVTMAVLAAASFLLAPPDSSPQAPGSSYSVQPDGAKAAYLVLKELGFDVQRSFEPIAEQRVDSAKTALILASPFEVPSGRDVRALRLFVERGGTVIAFGSKAGLFLPGVTAEKPERREHQLLTFHPALPGPLTRDAPELSAQERTRPSLDAAYLPVYASDREVGVVTARFGDGRVIWCFDDTPIQNSGLQRAANLHFLVNAVGIGGPRRVLWDEHYHGERRSLWSYLAATPLPWAALQLGIMAVVAVAGAARRRGPIWSRVAEPRTSPLEFIDTMGSLYERAGSSREAIESARTRLRRRLAGAAGISSSATDEQLVNAAAMRIGIDAGRTRDTLSRAADLLLRGVSRSKDAVAIVAELQELTATGREREKGKATRDKGQGARGKGQGTRDKR
jgi:Domain of unknown function (DUF4350)